MNKDVRGAIVRMVICVGLLCVIWCGYFIVKKYGVDRVLEIYDSDFSWVYQVDSTEIQGNKCLLNGFAFQLNEDAQKEAYEIVLRDLDTDERCFLEMKYCERSDVNNYFHCEFDYTNSGFLASIDAEKVKGKKYEVLLRVKGKKKAYRIETYLSDGKLMYVNPYEYQPLEVQGTDLEEIVNQGIIRVYRPDYGMYVYQYDGALYWIAEPEYGFVDGNTQVEYHLDTTQIERLPAIRLENEWYWDSIGFSFSEYEMTESNFGRYRVARKELPKEYSIQKIWTGNHINNCWIWIEYFLPFYQFE